MNPSEENVNKIITSFWPLCLLAVSLTVLLVWQVTLAGQQYVALVRLSDQQVVMTQQAVQTENKLKTMMMDLLELAKTDADARAIVTKFNIQYAPPPSSVQQFGAVPSAVESRYTK